MTVPRSRPAPLPAPPAPPAWQPIHLTLRPADPAAAEGSALDAALRGVLDRTDFRVVHCAAAGGDIHLIAEADGPTGLDGGVRALTTRLALATKARAGRRGGRRVEWEARVLHSPADVRDALRCLGEPCGEAAAVRCANARGGRVTCDPVTRLLQKFPAPPASGTDRQ